MRSCALKLIVSVSAGNGRPRGGRGSRGGRGGRQGNAQALSGRFRSTQCVGLHIEVSPLFSTSC